MKKQCLLIALLVAIMFPSVCVRAEGIEETNDLDLWALEDIVRALEGDWALFVPSFQWRTCWPARA